jgi:hypothetical protein
MKKENRFTCDLSDGSYKISAIIIDNKITESILFLLFSMLKCIDCHY